MLLNPNVISVKYQGIKSIHYHFVFNFFLQFFLCLFIPASADNRTYVWFGAHIVQFDHSKFLLSLWIKLFSKIFHFECQNGSKANLVYSETQWIFLFIVCAECLPALRFPYQCFAAPYFANAVKMSIPTCFSTCMWLVRLQLVQPWGDWTEGGAKASSAL